MFKLTKDLYPKVKDLVKDNYQLSLFSLINGITKGEVFVSSLEEPKSALIKTPECNYITGEVSQDFISFLKEELDFWDQIQLSRDCDESIKAHPNSFLRSYKRFYYSLDLSDIKSIDRADKKGFYRITPDFLERGGLKNIERIREWIDESWSSRDAFFDIGMGVCQVSGSVITSWSLTDCYYNDRVEIGIFTDEGYMGKGLGTSTVREMVSLCYKAGIKKIGWHCVATNIGSRSVAEKNGFKKVMEYRAYTPYPPIENEKDLTPSQWEEWGSYYRRALPDLTDYIWIVLESFAKANNYKKIIELLVQDKIRYETEWQDIMGYLKSGDIFKRFKDIDEWICFLR